VWTAGETGVSMVQLTVDGREDADNLISRLFKKTLVADVE
jgi:hypothetical protein